MYCYTLPSRTDIVILVNKIPIYLRRCLRKLTVIFVLFQTNLSFLDTLDPPTHTRSVLPSVLTAQLITAQLDRECVEKSVGLCS